MRQAEAAGTSEKPERRWWSRLLLAALVAASSVDAPVAASAGGLDALEPLTDEQWAAHVREVDAKVADALEQGRATAVTHTVDGDGVRWLPERAAWQRKIAGCIVEVAQARWHSGSWTLPWTARSTKDD
jgi:hypothetical protein